MSEHCFRVWFTNDGRESYAEIYIDTDNDTVFDRLVRGLALDPNKVTVTRLEELL